MSLESPLAFLLAPNSLAEYVGQSHLLQPNHPLRHCIESDTLLSMILWGPPGCGKTSLSKVMATQTNHAYFTINAVTDTVSDIRKLIHTAKNSDQKTVVFIDEIHRFNKAQQDVLLSSVESGLITLIGATTENPFFSVNPSLLSRCQLFELQPLTINDLHTLFNKGLQHCPVQLSEDAKQMVLQWANGDARKLLNTLELLHHAYPDTPVTQSHCETLLQKKSIPLSKNDHYDITSAWIKSMRGSDPDAALYWMTRLIEGGEQAEFIARRLIIFASEDIGNADPHALPLATALINAVQTIGFPEISINLSHVTLYMASAPKSNASYAALKKAQSAIQSGTLLAVPDRLKDTHYKGAKRQQYGKGYKYPHDYPNGIVNQPYLPKPMSLYSPKEIGYESTIKKRLNYIRKVTNHSD